MFSAVLISNKIFSRTAAFRLTPRPEPLFSAIRIFFFLPRFAKLIPVNHAALVSILSFCGAAICVAQDGVKSREVTPGPASKPGFTLQSPGQTGVTFTNELRGDAFLTNAVAHNGSGVAIGDINGDNLPDIFLCNLLGPSSLYKNLGNWRFENLQIGPAACEGQFSTGATFADIDNDRDLDLLVNGISAGTRLFLNDGKGAFTEKTDSGLSRTNSGTSLALADIDADGDLDLYSAHYADSMYLFDPLLRFGLARKGNDWIVTTVNGQPATLPRWTNRFVAFGDGRVRELPESHALYRNDGAGRFTPIQHTAFLDKDGKPIPPHRDWGLAVMFRDLNDDGAPDIYVCNDNASPDRIWINNGNGTFRAADHTMFRHFSRSAMGLDFADLNRDGHDDFIVVDMLAREHTRRLTQLVKDYPNPALKQNIDERPEYNRNSLFFGRPDGTYYEAALMSGVAASDWSWCPIFIDVDLDGYEDLLITNGFEFDVLDQDASDSRKTKRHAPNDPHRFFGGFPQFHTRNAAFRNRGDGTFEGAAAQWGFNKLGISNGMALGDLDNDGDMDVVVNNLNAAASLYRNDAQAPRVAVRLESRGVGAKIKFSGAAVTQTQDIISGGRYLSGDQEMRVFAANGNSPFTIEVNWRNGMQSIVTNVQPNRIYEISPLSAMKVERVAKKIPQPAFKETAAQTISFSKPTQRLEIDGKTILIERAAPNIEWSTLRIGSEEITGAWRALAAGDFNNDGKTDFIAANLGRNTEYELYQPTTFRTYIDNDAPLEAYKSGDQWLPIRDRLKLAPAFPNLSQRFTNHAAFARATISKIFAAQPRFIEAQRLESTLFLNRGAKFEPRPLPREAQLAPINAIAVADFDNDGAQDIFFAQNNFAGPSDINRDDNGRGLVLRGKGDGSFIALDPTQSGINLLGEQRAIATNDFNGDGRIDIAVSQNNLPPKFFLNQFAKPN